MGMDLHIWRARNTAVLKQDNWYESPNVFEEFYSCKFWAIPENCKFVPKNDPEVNGMFIPISIDEVEEMIEVACKHRNYWYNYNDVPKLCELRDKIEGWENDGWKLFLEYDF